MNLCYNCEQFNLHSFSNSRFPVHTRGYELTTVEQAAIDGCSFCSYLCCYLKDDIKEAKGKYGRDCWIHLTMQDASSAKIRTSFNPKKGLQYVQMRVGFGTLRKQIDLRYSEKIFRLVADPDSPAAVSGDVAGAFLGEDIGSDYHIEALNGWLQTCITHPACNETIAGDISIDDNYRVPLPSRVLDVGLEPPALKETAGEIGAYVALSHCWGNDPRKAIPKTTTSNLDQRKLGIPITELPKSFQDAIEVVRKLDINYIWIDSLCIVQDDSHDWRQESSRMARIYQLATFTIAATGAKDSTIGCFIPQNPESRAELVRLPYRTHQNFVQGYFYIHERSLKIEDEYKAYVQNGPLMTRAWALQERILSRRTVHYVQGRVFYECQTMLPMNDWHEYLPSDTHYQWQEYLPAKDEWRYRDRSDLSIIRRLRDSDFIEGSWYPIIEKYTSMALTRPNEDKLIAVSGIAREFQTRYVRQYGHKERPVYLSGLWTNDLPLGLLWQVNDVSQSRESKCGAPSWSWASMDSSVRWPTSSTDLFAEPSFSIVNPVLPAGNKKVKSTGRTWLHFKGKEINGENPAPQLMASGLTSNEPPLPLDLTLEATMTPITEIAVQARLRPLFKWETPLNEKSKILFAKQSLNNLLSAGTCYGVFCDTRRDLSGWGSFENRGKAPKSSGVPIYCLLVRTYRADGQLGRRAVSATHEVYSVLYLALQDTKFVRIGVGEIIEQDFFSGWDPMSVILA